MTNSEHSGERLARSAPSHGEVSWDQVSTLLERWHENNDHNVGRVVFTFLEQQFRLMIPTIARREWSGEVIEDVLRDLLLQIIERPTISTVENPRAYFKQALRHRFIDLHRARRRRNERPIDEERFPQHYEDRATKSAFSSVVAGERSARVRRALAQLAVADRIALKLDFAPEWLTPTEQVWLATRSGSTVGSVQKAVLTASGDTHALSRVFDPGDDDPDDPVARRKRMERFRRRRTRARERLFLLFQGVDL